MTKNLHIAIDVSPLQSAGNLQHRVRGVGMYISRLKEALAQYNKKNTYTFFTRGEKLPNNVDLVHYPYFEPFFLTLPLLSIFPFIVTVHDLTPFVFPKYFPAGIRGKLKWRIQRFLLQRTSSIITDSECSKRDIIKFAHIDDSRIHVVYLAASEKCKPIKDPQEFNRMRAEYHLPGKFILYVGDVTWNKNVPRLIMAVKKLNLTLVMVGKALASDNFERSNPWNQDLVLVNKLASSDKRIIRLGFLPFDDLVMLYNMAEVFVMPSLYEGFGLPVLEAMACGTPVVTAKSGSIPEVAGKSAYYVDPYDIDSIANGIGAVFFSVALKETLSHKGLVQSKNFSWKKTSENTVRVYEQSLHLTHRNL